MSKGVHETGYWQTAPKPREQLVLFAETLDACLSEDHPVRLVDEILDRLDWTSWEAQYHGRRGQPPIHPSVLCKVLLFALVRGIRSSRQIEYQLRHSIDFIWLASGRTIDHSTISDFRRRHQQSLRDVYQQMVKVAIDLKVAQLSTVCIDGTRVLANTDRRHRWTQESLAKAMAELDDQMATALSEWEAGDEQEASEPAADQLPKELAGKKTRRQQLDRAMASLKELDSARRAKGRGKKPAQIPKTDVDARILPNKEGGYAGNFTPLVVTETSHGFIVASDLVIGSAEHTMLSPLVEQVEADYAQEVTTILGDGAYATGENLRECEAREIELLAPLAEPKREENPALRDDPTVAVSADEVDRLPIKPQTQRFDTSAFVYDATADCYFCPQGQRMPYERTQTVTRSGKRVAQRVYRCSDCAGCVLATSCRTNLASPQGRSVTRDEYESVRERHRERMKGEEQQACYAQRMHYAETPFAVLKTLMNLRRFLTRGHENVRTEWLWGCLAFNLKKLMRLLATGEVTWPAAT